MKNWNPFFNILINNPGTIPSIPDTEKVLSPKIVTTCVLPMEVSKPGIINKEFEKKRNNILVNATKLPTIINPEKPAMFMSNPELHTKSVPLRLK
jgi:hypothetical protein